MIRGETYFTEALAGVSDDIRRRVALSMKVSDRIASVLKAQGMTAHDLARRMHCSDAEVSRWLSGTHNFTLSTLARIASALHTDIILCP